MEEMMGTFFNIRLSTLVFTSCLASFPVGAAEIALDASPGMKWVTAASPNGMPQIPVHKDDVLIIRHADPNASHGFRFTGTGAPSTIPLCDAAPASDAVFCQVSPYNRNMSALGSGANAKGEFLRLRVLQDLPTDMPFQCTVHGGMTGTLKK